MKKLLLPFLLVLLVLPVWAQASALSFTTKRGEPFLLILNGKPVNPVATNVVRVANLQPGRHYVQFRISGRYGLITSGFRITVPLGHQTNYLVHTPSGRRGRVRLQKISIVPLPPPVASTQPVPPQQPNPPYTETYPGDYPTEAPAPEPAEKKDGFCQNMLSKYDLDKLVTTIKARESESTRMAIAREAISKNSILSEDLKILLEQFEFETSRLEFAKFAFDYVCDKERFYYVYDAFKFDTSIKELQNYTSRRR
ncbi:DUF4476 domain-containing protein [Botryobacter ruber]|uniref:DUF4476 domain-containing protein n=1 Tax=Botryobacter ruber TaxID=2171629 RepID=UPI000E0B38F7|nr:DUF4476 domain-containing protein [Botryobacter ruber]